MEKTRKRKSVRLTPEERKAFKKYVNGFDTKLDCAEALGVHFNTLPRILKLGKCHPDTYIKILNTLFPDQKDAA